ncbi:serine hydrolase [Frigoribacterium sp. MCBA15_019]|uniref:serine hydrolase domain-containing protein n=1 Tax=Frigoribacterium sp. MCBA15_019 TaxID=1898745 RepID=UPI0008DD06E6|nr:serine hydrolase domain-containing protein [Frigoribacterium sp. MCBA15_019]OII26335.1 serine hydrolase [Frigoribacterium sp. MCBA15_019]
MTPTTLPRSTPSAQNVDAAGISAFVDALETTAGVEPHSIMLLRHGQVVAEGWWAPYSADRAHLLYSLSKSFTSSAVGFAVAEGLMGLDDTVLGHFPELDAEVTDPRSRSMRVRHVLAMASGHRAETLDRALAVDPVDVVRGFLLTPPDDEPGTVFAYNQPCTFAAGAIVQRVTGQSLSEYLRPRLLDPLGIGEVGWQRDESGRELGFSGLHATTHAIAALGQLYLQQGEWDGTQLLPREWVAEATRSHVSNAGESNPDWAQGYGFQFWMARHGYRGDGAYGQFAVVLPEHDVVLALTGQSLDMQAVLDAAWAHLLPVFGTDAARIGDAAADDSLATRLADLTLPGVAGPTEHDAAPVRPAAEEARVGDQHSPGTERLVSFTAADGNDQPSLSVVELRASADAATTLTLVEGDSRLVARVEAEDWVVTDGSDDGSREGVGVGDHPAATPVAASATRSADLLHVDLVFVETPHRLHLTLDEADATFTALWETQPLHAPRLAELRMPRD